jgi:hypothetical protein
MSVILVIFIVIFFSISGIALIVSFVAEDKEISSHAKSAVWPAFFIGIILLYLRFVLT